MIISQEHWAKRRVAIILERPFFRLVRLFVARTFESGGEPGEDQLDLGLGLALVLLALPGAIISILLFDKYGSLLQWLRAERDFDPYVAAFPDEYFFIVLSMVVTGAVAVWWWDSIFLDRRDYQNLVPLPLSMRRILGANIVAIVFLTIIFAVDVNAASSILFPVVVAAGQQSFSYLIHFAIVHASVVILASIFSFLSVFALVGTLTVVLPYRVFRRISLWVRVFIIVGLLGLLASSFAVPSMAEHLSQHEYSVVQFLPSVWFVGLCQILRHRADPSLVVMGQCAWVALGCASVVAAASWVLSYRMVFDKFSEATSVDFGYSSRLMNRLFSVFDRILLHSPLERAGYRFTVRTLLCNQRLGLLLGGIIGIGIVVAAQTAFRAAILPVPRASLPSAEMLSIPLILSYCLLVGLRLAFDIPIEVHANWIFKLISSDEAGEGVRLARKLMLTISGLCVLVLILPAYAHYWNWALAMLHALIIFLSCVLLTEILLLRFRKIPFTCLYPPFRDSAIVSVMICVFGFVAFTFVISKLEHRVLSNRPRIAILVPLSILAWYCMRRIREELTTPGEQLIFEHVPTTFELLKLNDGG